MKQNTSTNIPALLSSSRWPRTVHRRLTLSILPLFLLKVCFILTYDTIWRGEEWKNNLRYKLNSKHFTQTGKKMNTGSKTKKRQSKKYSSNEIIFSSTFALYFLPVCLRFSLSFWKQIIAQHVSHSFSLINFHFFFFCLHLSIYKG